MSEDSLLFLPAKEFFSFGIEGLTKPNEQEVKAMIQLNQAGTDWLNGKINTAEYTDILSQHNVNPDEHLADNDWYLNQMYQSA